MRRLRHLLCPLIGHSTIAGDPVTGPITLVRSGIDGRRTSREVIATQTTHTCTRCSALVRVETVIERDLPTPFDLRLTKIVSDIGDDGCRCTPGIGDIDEPTGIAWCSECGKRMLASTLAEAVRRYLDAREDRHV